MIEDRVTTCSKCNRAFWDSENHNCIQLKENTMKNKSAAELVNMMIILYRHVNNYKGNYPEEENILAKIRIELQTRRSNQKDAEARSELYGLYKLVCKRGK